MREADIDIFTDFVFPVLASLVSKIFWA